MEDTELLSIIYNQNPWWENKQFQVPIKKRRDFYVLERKLDDKQITAIIGPRRVGKSILMQQLIESLLQKQVTPQNILFAQLDEPRFDTEGGVIIHRILDIYSKLVLKQSLDETPNKAYVFLDEIQHIDKWSETLKSLYDRDFNIKFIVSGSSSAGITRGSSESLAGRISLNLVMTLKFIDFLKFKDINSDLDEISRYLRNELKEAVERNDPNVFFQVSEESIYKHTSKTGDN